MKKNNYELLPIVSISSDGNLIKYNQTYESIISHPNEECEENY